MEHTSEFNTNFLKACHKKEAFDEYAIIVQCLRVHF